MNRLTEYLADWPDGPSPIIAPITFSAARNTVEVQGSHGITVTLERMSGHSATGGALSDSPVTLSIDGGDALWDDHDQLVLNHPTALRALIGALMRLTADPRGAELLASITPELEEEPDDTDDGDDDDGEDRKRGATL